MGDGTKKREDPEQLSDILLVLDREKMKIQAVKSIDKNGKMETVDPTKKNQSEFMRVDKHGDFVSNFLSNFWRQLKDPTQFTFFKVSADEAIEKAREFQKQVDRPTPRGKKEMKKHEVKNKPEKEQKQVNQKNMETTQATPETSEYRYKLEQIDWETMNNLGLGKERLEKLKLLDPLLKGYKTNELVPVSINLGSAIVRMDARLSLQRAQDGKVVAAIHGIRKEPNLGFEFFGHSFTEDDKQNLRQTGNMGRVVNLKNFKTGEILPSIISVDRFTNELIALRTEFIKIPEEIKGIKLDEGQKQTLMEGKPLHLEGMISKKGEPFSADVQFNADKRYVEFLFDRNISNQQSRGTGPDDHEGGPQEAPRIFRGKELDEDRYNRFKAGQTVYIDGLVDKKGQGYQGYITYNLETGRTDFSFKNPNRLKEQAIPADIPIPQVAVNSEGKTDGVTKKVKVPLKSGQKNPDSEKQPERQGKSKAPAKSKGIKM